MARVITEGFEAGVSILPYAGFVGFAEAVRVGYGAINLYAPYGQNPNAIASFSFPTSLTLTAAFIKFALAGNVNSLHLLNENGVSFFELRRNGSVFDYYAGSTYLTTGTAVWSSAWTNYEIKFDLVSKAVEVRLGGQPDYVGTPITGTHTRVGSVYFTYNNHGYATLNLNDVVVNTPDATADGSWPGDRRIIGIVPIGNGASSQLVGSDNNSADNWALMSNRQPNGDADYVQSSTNGAYDFYTLTNPTLLTGYQVKRVIVEADARQTVAQGSASVQLGLKLGTNTIWSSPAIPVNTNWQNLRREFSRPGGGAWSNADIDALEAGVKVVS